MTPAKPKASAPEVDLASILSGVQKLYAKDPKSQDMIVTGVQDKEYTETDGVPLPEGNIIRELLNIPCIPFDKIIQVAGDSDTGKSTTAYAAIASAQRDGWQVIVWETEGKFDATRLRGMGGNPDKLAFVKTNEILQGGEKVRKIIHALKKAYPDLKILLVWDSIGGSQSRSHAEKELDNEKSAQPGQDAKENAMVMKMLVSLFNKYPNSLAVYAANQVYAKIGFMQFGNEQSGGKKVYFHSSAIIVLKRLKVVTKMEKGKKIKIGIITRATLHKNHLTQGKTSNHQMDFQITADSVRPVDMAEDDGESEE